MKFLILISLFSSLYLHSLSQVINVPADFPTIQSAIDISTNGDTILVSPGTYQENINYNGKNILVASHFILNSDSSLIESSIIDGNESGRVVTINNGEFAILKGFTIQNGNHLGGGGVYTSFSEIVLENLIIKNNIASDDGGGIHCHNSIMTIKNSSLINNQASVYGGGVFIEQCSDILIENCVIEDNTSVDGGGIYIDNCQSSIKLNDLLVINNSSTSHGGGLAAYNLNLEISNSQFSNNLSSTGGGMYFANSNIDLIYCDISLNIAENTNNTGTGGGVMFSAYSSNSSNANIQNCTFYDNQANIIQANGIALAANASFGSGIYDLNIVNSIIWENVEIINNGTVNVSYSNTQNNFAGSGNISEISNFISIDPANPNYNLLLGSPCINSGNPSNIYNDFDGTRNDMGAYPYNFNTFLYDNLVSEELYTICNTNDSIQISSLHNNLSVSEFPGEIESFSYEGCFEGTHYYLSDGLHDWNDAESLCSENGGAMLEINSQLEQYFIQNIVVEGPNVFLGIKNDTLIWESGSDVIFSNWNTNDLVHDYGEFYWETFEWGMDPLTSEHRICLEIEGDGNCPQETSYLWSNGDTSSTAYFNSNDIGVNWLSQTINNTVLNDTFLIDISNSTSNIDISECDSYEWNGQTYTESGEYTNTYTNANGCDSTHTLNLTINNSISSNTEASSCSSYEWNGMIYENSGTYEFDTIASNGCDSTAMLELEICYLDQLEINGPTAAVTSTTSSFSVQENAGSIYEWSLSNELGEISSGQNSNEINVDWSTDEGLITICVLEKYDCSGLECLGDTVCLEVELKRPAGVVENNLEVNIYPNPSSNIFNLEFNSDSGTEILVTNALGEQVYFESVQSVGEFNTQIDLSNYSKGIYNLTIKNTNGINNHKLILQ